MKLSPKLRKAVSNEVRSFLKKTYFQEIPFTELCEILKKYDIVILQEDNTEWNGFLLGYSGDAFFHLAPISSVNSDGFYFPYTNAGFVLTWYRCYNRYDNAFEVIGYIS